MAVNGETMNAVPGVEPVAAKDRDPYIVSLVKETRQPRPERLSEDASVVFDELQSSSLRRRTHLLNGGH